MLSLKALLAVLLVGLPAIPLAAGGDCAGTRSAPVHDGSVTYTDFAAMNTSHIRTGPDGSARLDNSGYAMLGENIVHQGPGDQTAPSLGALAGGGYAVAWMDDRGAGYDIYAAVLDRAGK